MSKEIHPLILKRRSIFSFSDKFVDDEKLKLLFEAAGKAPSSFNAQPWEFIYASRENPRLYSRLAGLLSEENQVWALSAPVLVLSLAEVISKGRSKENVYAFHDLGMATGNLLLQASYMGLFVHPMGGYDKEMAKQKLKFPDRYKPAAMMAIGYPGSNKNLPEKLKKRLITGRRRNDLNDFVWKGIWKEA